MSKIMPLGSSCAIGPSAAGSSSSGPTVARKAAASATRERFGPGAGPFPAVAAFLPDLKHRLRHGLAPQTMDRLQRLEDEEAQLRRQGKHVGRETQSEKPVRAVPAPRGERLRLIEP
jgi:hypothetical protein